MAAAFDWHNYGKSTIGNRTDIERVPIKNLQAFYKKYYQPDNCLLVIAGKFDEAKALALVEKYFGELPKPTRKLDKTYTEEPPQDGERSVTLAARGRRGPGGSASITFPRAGTRTRRPGRAGQHPQLAAVGPACTRRWSKPRRPPTSRPAPRIGTIRACSRSSAEVRKGDSLEAAQRHLARRDREGGRHAVFARRRSNGPSSSCSSSASWLRPTPAALPCS